MVFSLPCLQQFISVFEIAFRNGRIIRLRSHTARCVREQIWKKKRKLIVEANSCDCGALSSCTRGNLRATASCVICEGQLGYRRPRTPARTRRKRVARRGGARPALLIAPKHTDRIRDSAWSPRSRQFRTLLPGTHAGSSPERSRRTTRANRDRTGMTMTTKNYRLTFASTKFVINPWGFKK